MSGAIGKEPTRKAAERLRDCKRAIVEDYAAALKQEIPAAAAFDRETSIDSLPELLDAIAESSGSSAGPGLLDTLGVEHGRARAQQATYSLSDLLNEERILKRLVNAALRRSTRLPCQAEDDVSDALDVALAASAVEFAQQRSHKLLVETTRAEERHKLEAIFSASPAAMALWCGPNMAFELVNPAYEAIFPGRELVGRPFLDALPEFRGQPFFELFSRVLATGEPYVGKEVLARHRSTPDGPIEDHYYDFTYTRIDDIRGQPYGVFNHAIDVTTRVLARRALAEREEHLQRAVNELTQERTMREHLVAGISHDVRTPLSAAMMTAHLVARRAEDRDAVCKGAGRIADNLGRVDGMLRDLLDASRMNAGQGLALEFQPCELRKVVEDALVELSAVHGDRFVLRGDTRIEGVWNCRALRRILENLCNNAVTHGSTEQPITVSIHGNGERVELRVHNDGEPIPPEAIPRLFDPFHGTGTARKRGHRGWGLGLTLVKGFAEAHGGRVTVESSREHGTTFRVSLPVDPRNGALAPPF